MLLPHWWHWCHTTLGKSDRIGVDFPVTCVFANRSQTLAILAFAATLATSTLRSTPAFAQSYVRNPNELARTVALNYLEAAAVQERANHPGAALSLYEHAISADHSLLDGYVGYARLLLLRGRRDAAETALRSAYPAAVSTEDALILWAKSLAELGFVQGALEALAPTADNARTLRVMAELCVAAARLPEALAYARRAYERSADDPSTQSSSRQLVRALTMLVGEIDPVRYPGPRASTLRRLLSR